LYGVELHFRYLLLATSIAIYVCSNTKGGSLLAVENIYVPPIVILNLGLELLFIYQECATLVEYI